VLRYVVHKGSITVDGISLTVSAWRPILYRFVDPGNARADQPGRAEVGTVVNLEVDVLAKYVERLMRR